MSFAARPIIGADVVPLENITVHADQDRFIAPNIVTIAQVRFKTGAHDFCLWNDQTRVGLMALVDMVEHKDRHKIDAPDAIYVWRLLIGQDFQRQGYGAAAMAFAENWGRARGRRVMQIQAVEDNAAAIAMYQSLGYVLTGKRSGVEVQLEKLL
ncbi:GNAT family N-acetyltransferase [Loktanella sp. Alg231-35]|uniref:GNAT family N-acetyltransferase n=1 Tax=Loktanella sp. Alg231-35 TaxID=1922220 RepID=UPI000D55995A|nr:GNAT family N-acetyltransferase [Loktanella sp. Alg231-35]